MRVECLSTPSTFTKHTRMSILNVLFNIKTTVIGRCGAVSCVRATKEDENTYLLYYYYYHTDELTAHHTQYICAPLYAFNCSPMKICVHVRECINVWAGSNDTTHTHSFSHLHAIHIRDSIFEAYPNCMHAKSNCSIVIPLVFACFYIFLPRPFSTCSDAIGYRESVYILLFPYPFLTCQLTFLFFGVLCRMANTHTRNNIHAAFVSFCVCVFFFLFRLLFLLVCLDSSVYSVIVSTFCLVFLLLLYFLMLLVVVFSVFFYVFVCFNGGIDSYVHGFEFRC